MYSFGIMIPVDKETNFEKKFQEAKAIGIDSCQLSFWDPNLYAEATAKRIQTALQKTGFSVSLLWAGWSGPQHWNFIDGPATLGLVPERYRDIRLNELKKASDFALRLGIKDIATHVGFLPENPTDPAYPPLVDSLRSLCLFLKERGQNFLFETGQETPVTLLRTIERIGTGNVFINFDTANLVLYGKANSADAVTVLGKYIRNTHVKDGRYPTCGDELGVETKVGDGVVDFQKVLSRLKKFGYQGPLTIEREIVGEQQRRDIVSAINYLKNIIKDEETV